ncbi:MAG: cell division protein FtsQ, partial [Prevotella sp.]|nr:cell division protein FtsQ [Prevotella sp.]
MKKYIIIFIDITLAVYLLLAVTAFNNPQELATKCTKVNINITDETTYGFLNADEIKAILTKKGLYP